MSPPAAPGGAGAFDLLAATYDRSFTHSTVGSLQRQAVERRLDARFAPGMHVLEIGCGTGEDAIRLARGGIRLTATDISAEMVAEARRKVRRAGLERQVEVAQMAIEQLAAAREPDRRPGGLPGRAYDGAFSNFGALNCVADLTAVADGLAARLPAGAPVLLCLMGPLVPWEWLWYLARLRPGKAFRRLRPGGARWRGLTVRYPSIARTRRAFGRRFAVRRVAAVGALLPPTFAERWAARHPGPVARLARLERRLETLPPLPWLADHYLIEMERR